MKIQWHPLEAKEEFCPIHGSGMHFLGMLGDEGSHGLHCVLCNPSHLDNPVRDLGGLVNLFGPVSS